MTTLHEVQCDYAKAVALVDAKRARRDDMIRAAIKAGLTHATIAADTGLTRGRVNQIARGRR